MTDFPWIRLGAALARDPDPAPPETFLTRCYGTPPQVGQITTVKERKGRIVAETTSGIPVILPTGGFDFATYLDHTDI